MEHTIARHKNSGNAYVSHIKGSKSEALKKKKDNAYDKSFREGKIPPHAKGSLKVLKELGESFRKRREK